MLGSVAEGKMPGEVAQPQEQIYSNIKTHLAEAEELIRDIKANFRALQNVYARSPDEATEA